MLDSAAVLVVFFSAILIAIADSVIKTTAQSGNFLASATSPWMIAICVLYFVQILMAVFVFVHKGDLAIYANVFIVFYSILMVAIGMWYFGERVTSTQVVGIVLALVGAVLINGSF